jgi:hypothetical protein
MDIDMATVKEAFFRTFSGAGELWFDYFEQDEAARRLTVVDDWETFLEHVADVKNGVPHQRPRTGDDAPLALGRWLEMRRCPK